VTVLAVYLPKYRRTPMSAPSINESLTEDHDRLDGLLESFQEWRAKDTDRAKDFLMLFTLGLRRHLQWEETVLFPLFEQKKGQTGLTNTLRGEHEEIREWLGALNQKIEQNDADCDHEEKMLVEELGGHNAREEYALYPELDKLLTDVEKDAAFEAMAAVPEDRR
jgi:regulator of cell morphogenesis and NO signaling